MLFNNTLDNGYLYSLIVVYGYIVKTNHGLHCSVNFNGNDLMIMQEIKCIPAALGNSKLLFGDIFCECNGELFQICPFH